MHVNYKVLRSAIESGDRRYANFYDTYGFLVIRNLLSKQEFKECVREYDSEYKRRTGELSPWEILLNQLGFSGPKMYSFRQVMTAIFRRGMSFLPYFAEDSKYFTSLLASTRMRDLFKYFCGENWLYLGSDGSRFATTSFPWHRDWYTKAELMKCNFYFNTLPFFGGRFLLIPGSQHVGDVYGRRIQKSISWPMQNKKPSGMNENEHIPDIINPREKFKFFGRFSKTDAFDVPHVKIKVKKGDLVIFDQRMLHCVETSYPQTTRRLMTFLISKNAFDLPAEHESLEKFTRQEIMTDLLDLIVNERNHIGCQPWGAAYEESELSGSNHYIKIEKSDGSDLYNKASGWTSEGLYFECKVDFGRYALLGASYRQKFVGAEKAKNDHMAQAYGYHDVHLGINCQNIK